VQPGGTLLLVCLLHEQQQGLAEGGIAGGGQHQLSCNRTLILYIAYEFIHASFDCRFLQLSRAS